MKVESYVDLEIKRLLTSAKPNNLSEPHAQLLAYMVHDSTAEGELLELAKSTVGMISVAFAEIEALQKEVKRLHTHIHTMYDSQP